LSYFDEYTYSACYISLFGSLKFLAFETENGFACGLPKSLYAKIYCN